MEIDKLTIPMIMRIAEEANQIKQRDLAEWGPIYTARISLGDVGCVLAAYKRVVEEGVNGDLGTD